MSRLPLPSVLFVALLLLGSAAAGIAFAAEGSFDAGNLIEASAPAGLLPTITIEGRKGWACTAERNATATKLPDAALPADR